MHTSRWFDSRPGVMVLTALLSVVTGAMLAIGMSVYSRTIVAGGAASQVPALIIFVMAVPITFQGVFMAFSILQEFRYRRHFADRVRHVGHGSKTA